MPQPETHPTYDWRNQHLGRLLDDSALAFKTRAAQLLREKSHTSLRVRHIDVFACIDTQGTRLTDIGKRLDISKQAATQLVAPLIKEGYLERHPDPNDGRASMIRFTSLGKKILDYGKIVIQELESYYQELLGEEKYLLFIESLGSIYNATSE